jgi:HEXXH motif-containing protein
MTGFSTFELWDKAAQKARDARFLKLALLCEWAQAEGARDSILAVALPALVALPYGTIFTNNNTFFWSALDNCARLMQSGALPAESERRLASLLFDAFFHQLPNSFGLPLTAGGDQVVALPELRIRSEGRLDRIQKQSRDIALLQGVDDTAIEITAPLPQFQLRTRPIDGHVTSMLLLDSGTNLFSPSYGHLVIPRLEEELGAKLGETIGEALAFLDGLDAKFALRIGATINWYIPVRSDDPQMHISFSVPKLAGVIFLSQPTPEMGVPGWLKIGEVLAHEFAHNELNLYQESNHVFRDDPERRFYSPWRSDPRPLNGLFHGIYSFWHVAEFFRCSLQSGELQNFEASAEESYRQTLLQLRVALWQIPSELLTPEGQDIIDIIANGVNAQLDGADLRDTAGDAKLQAHIAQWRTRNPSYALDIKLN